jgi:tetratricopeptide (TPR) repeat protein
LLCACAAAHEAPPLPAGAQCLSLDGKPLYIPPTPPEDLAAHEAALAEAEAAFRAAPGDADARVMYGRRLSQLGRFQEALAVFEQGEQLHPEDPRFPRFAGHRLITLRRPEEAERVLERAERLARGRPDEDEPALDPGGHALETLHHAIDYHLGLARFLQGDFAGAEQAYRGALAAATNDDARCSATHWLYSTLRREGKDAEAAAALAQLGTDLNVVEYHSYHKLIQLYQGSLDPEALLAEARSAGSVDQATVGFGVGNWHLAEGRKERAHEIFAEVEAGPAWHAFGHIASEYELARERAGAR